MKTDLPSISIRFFKVIEALGLTPYQVAKNVNVKISNSGFTNIKSGRNKPSGKVLDSFLNEYKQVNKVWLLTGEGEMLKNSSEKKYEEAVQVNPHIKYIPIVSQYAYGGYLGGFDDPGYMESLPTQPFMIDTELKGNYVVFEVKGDSMDNDSNESLREGDLLLSREVRCEYWKYKLHINKWNFVIVHKTEGILIKKIIAHDVEKGIITLHSLNPLYEDRELNLNDVAQIFNVVQAQRKF